MPVVWGEVNEWAGWETCCQGRGRDQARASHENTRVNASYTNVQEGRVSLPGPGPKCTQARAEQRSFMAARALT